MGLLAITFILLINPSVFNLKSVKASTVGVEWGHLADGFSVEEYNWEYQICWVIDDAYFTIGYNHLMAYWELTTSSNVEQALTWIQNPQNGMNFGTTWWVGDFQSGISTPLHYGFNGGAVTIWDSTVYNSANAYRNSIQYFDFIWTCVNAGVYSNDQYGGQTQVEGITYPKQYPSPPEVYNPNTYYGYYHYYTGAGGMAYAWTGTLNMAQSGYPSPDPNDYCYIGFQGASPFLMDSPPQDWSSTDNEYGWFPYYFYIYGLGFENYGTHRTIAESLDYAARMTFGRDNYNEDYTFETSILNHPYWRYCSLGQGMSGF